MRISHWLEIFLDIINSAFFMFSTVKVISLAWIIILLYSSYPNSTTYLDIFENWLPIGGAFGTPEDWSTFVNMFCK